jgi:hypothetical protein
LTIESMNRRRSYRAVRWDEMSAMYAGIAFTVVISIPALVREIHLARRAGGSRSWPTAGG